MRRSKLLQSSKDMLHRGFKADKCKTSLRLVTSRLKLLRNKKEVQLKQMKREVAQMLETGQDRTARIKVEHVVREEKMMAAYELIGLYSELIISRLPIIESQKNCPIDMKEAITSLIFASPRCGDVPELLDVQKHFTTKYGKDFVTSALELRPDCGVSRMLVEKLSAKAPDGQTKLKILSAIADEHSIKWDPKSFEENELSAPNDLLSGPTAFENAKVYAQSPQREPLKPEQYNRFSQRTESVNHTHSEGRTTSSPSQHEVRYTGVASERPGKESFSGERKLFASDRQNWNMDFKDAASAAHAAAESAERASMAARAAAELANRDSMKNSHYTESHQSSSTHLRRNSSDLSVERLPRDPHSRYPSSDSEHMQHVGYSNPEGFPARSIQADRDNAENKVRSNRDGYEGAENYRQPSNLRSNSSAGDDSFAHGTLDADRYTKKRVYEEGSAKPDIMMTQFDKSEYTRDLHECSRSEDFHNIEEEKYGKRSDSSLHSQPKNYDDNNDASDLNHRYFESHAAADLHNGMDKGHSHRETSRMASFNSTPAVFDEAGSDDDKNTFDTGPQYDDHDSDVDSTSSEREAPSNVFTSPSAQVYGFDNSRSPKRSVFLPEKHSFHEFSEVSAALVDEFKFDDPLPLKYDSDQSDGPKSESDDSMHESGHSGRKYSAKFPGRGDQIFPSSRTPTKEQGNQGSEEKPRLKLTPDEPDDETLSQTSSELSSKLNFGKLTGGLRHKRYGLPPYRSSQVDDASFSLKNPIEESFSPILDSPASVTTQNQVNTEDRQNTDSRTNRRASVSHYDSEDTNSSEDEHPVQISLLQKEPTSQNASKEKDTNSRLKGSYFESDLDDFPKGPREKSAGRNHLPGGLSRRTKATPATSRTPQVQLEHDETKEFNFGSERNSTSSSYYSPREEPKSQTRSSGQSRISKQSSSKSGSFKQRPDLKSSLRQESPKSAVEEQPASPQQKRDGTDSGSQASLPKKDPVTRVDSSKKASHVHPKLPDFESFFAHMGSLKNSRQ